MTSNNARKRSAWVARSLTALVTIVFLGSGITKLAQVPKIVEPLVHAGVPLAAVVPIGVLEICLALLYMFPRTSVLGTFLLTGFVGGAIVTHIIGRESFAPPLVVGIVMFSAAYLRHSQLRELVPLRGTSHVSDDLSPRSTSVSS